MSCLRLRKYRNPKKNPSSIDKPFISIPDGKCSECKKTRTNDWLVRAYYEFQSKPQDCFFVTLDFDDDHLPHYNGIHCFDYTVIHNFLRNLREVAGLKYRFLAVPDYGDAFDRVHYHVIFLTDRGRYSEAEFFS